MYEYYICPKIRTCPSLKPKRRNPVSTTETAHYPVSTTEAAHHPVSTTETAHYPVSTTEAAHYPGPTTEAAICPENSYCPELNKTKNCYDVLLKNNPVSHYGFLETKSYNSNIIINFSLIKVINKGDNNLILILIPEFERFNTHIITITQDCQIQIPKNIFKETNTSSSDIKNNKNFQDIKNIIVRNNNFNISYLKEDEKNYIYKINNILFNESYNCEGGKYLDYDMENNNLLCKDCPIGSYCQFSSRNLCPTGTYGQNENLTTIDGCIKCDRDTFSKEEGSVKCELCTSYDKNSWTNYSKGSKECVCKQGYIKNNNGGICEKAECVGKYLLNNQLFDCRIGNYCNNCFSNPCSKDSYQDKSGQSSCIKCPKGYYTKNTGSTKLEDCIICQKGYYCQNGSLDNPRKCQPGYYCPEGSNIQIPCQPGTYCPNEGMSEPFSCKKGYYCPNEKMTFMIPCPNGHSCPTEDLTEPKPCEKGYYNYAENNENGFVNCQPCSKNTYSNVEGTVLCLSCPEGSYTAKEGSENCSTCNLGEYLKDGKCQKCPKGSYTDQKGSISCKLCPKGSYTDLEGSTYCELCPEGSYTNIEGSDKCFNCPTGTYSDEKGLKECKLCAEGSYMDKEGSTYCIECEHNYNCPVGSKEPICISGYYCTDKSKPGKICPENYFCEDGKKIECPEGYFSNKGWSRCHKKCELGYYYNIAENECVLCPKGYKCPKRSSEPIKCTGKTFALEGSDDCFTCDATLIQENGLNVGCRLKIPGEECTSFSQCTIQNCPKDPENKPSLCQPYRLEVMRYSGEKIEDKIRYPIRDWPVNENGKMNDCRNYYYKINYDDGTVSRSVVSPCVKPIADITGMYDSCMDRINKCKENL